MVRAVTRVDRSDGLVLGEQREPARAVGAREDVERGAGVHYRDHGDGVLDSDAVLDRVGRKLNGGDHLGDARLEHGVAAEVERRARSQARVVGTCCARVVGARGPVAVRNDGSRVRGVGAGSRAALVGAARAAVGAVGAVRRVAWCAVVAAARAVAAAPVAVVTVGAAAVAVVGGFERDGARLARVPIVLACFKAFRGAVARNVAKVACARVPLPKGVVVLGRQAVRRVRRGLGVERSRVLGRGCRSG
mmetsp:Transcript_21650/g.74493  ORF Transcript_21650/g.74493 Transcript_21650/m.74493 type:complete len:248 (+) Transcript_21650:370-1113(+)